MPETRNAAREFGRRWIEDWNRNDLEAILAHYAEDVRFRSPKAKIVTGAANVAGKAALRAYLSEGLRRGAPRFVLEQSVFDPELRTVVLFYQATIAGATTNACEVLSFGTDGLVSSSEAFYGAAER